jgi:AcrR family transcriptional regulator
VTVPEPVPGRKRLLVQAARKLFSERPYEKVTTTEIARTAGVSYGLIAHYFGDKRGLYRAVMDDIATELAAGQGAPLEGATPAERLRGALAHHVRYIDANAAGFVALMHGDLGSDIHLRAMLDRLRWNGASRVLEGVGIDDPPSGVMRAAMRAWVAYFDELILRRLESGGIDATQLVELAAASLVTTLRVAVTLEPAQGLPEEARDALLARISELECPGSSLTNPERRGRRG